MQLKGRVAIVTGASRGLGKSMAIELAREGALVAVAARTTAPGQTKLPGTIHETVHELEKFGGQAFAVRCDVADEGSVTEMIEKVKHQYGRIDILINKYCKNCCRNRSFIPVVSFEIDG